MESPAGRSDVKILVYTGDFRYEPEVQRLVDEAWSEAIEKNPELISHNALKGKTSPFTVKLTQGADDTAVTLAVLAAKDAIQLGAIVLRDLWKSWILPRIKKDHVVREKQVAHEGAGDSGAETKQHAVKRKNPAVKKKARKTKAVVKKKSKRPAKKRN